MTFQHGCLFKYKYNCKICGLNKKFCMFTEVMYGSNGDLAPKTLPVLTRPAYDNQKVSINWYPTKIYCNENDLDDKVTPIIVHNDDPEAVPICYALFHVPCRFLQYYGNSIDHY